MKQIDVKIGSNLTKITVVDSKSKQKVLSENDKEMDKLVEVAVKAAITKAKICKRPIAEYNPKLNLVTISNV